MQRRKQPSLKNETLGRVNVVLCSVFMDGFEMIHASIQQLWFKVCSAPTAYGSGLRALQKTILTGMWEGSTVSRTGSAGRKIMT